MTEIVLATNNEGKIKEFIQLFKNESLTVIPLKKLAEQLPDVEETGTTFEENAILKAKTIGKYIEKFVIADDSGLIVDALNGRPGIYSARYAGIPTNDYKNNEKLLTDLKHIPEGKRSARFISVLAFYQPNKGIKTFEGRCEGKIGFEPIGDEGFGYDPIFIPKGYNVTMAQLNKDEKNKISHRSDALQRFKKWFNSKYDM